MWVKLKSETESGSAKNGAALNKKSTNVQSANQRNQTISYIPNLTPTSRRYNTYILLVHSLF